jgi:hypothetical protein
MAVSDRGETFRLSPHTWTFFVQARVGFRLVAFILTDYLLTVEQYE